MPTPTPTDPTLASTGALPPGIAFPERARRVADLLARVPLDHASFDRPLGRCDLARCHGICCTDGAPLDAEEARVLGALADEEHEAFVAMGVRADRLVAVSEPGGPGHTGLRSRHPTERPDDGLTEGLALPDTTCAAMLDDGRCAFQVLAIARGRHPWYWKPMICWLHPVVADAEGIRLLPEGVSRERAYRERTFATVTPCSLGDPGADRASRTLRPELEFLGGLIGRDLRAELGTDR